MATTNQCEMEKGTRVVEKEMPKPLSKLFPPLSQGLLQSVPWYLHTMPREIQQQCHPPVFDLQQLMSRLQEGKGHLQVGEAAVRTQSSAGGKGRLRGVSACCSLLPFAAGLQVEQTFLICESRESALKLEKREKPVTGVHKGWSSLMAPGVT